MARAGARSTCLAFLLLLAGARLALYAVSFVAPSSGGGDDRGARTALRAELMKKDVKTDLTAFR
eukprot:CAMPEP_0115427188 /NCGR_PEP_ID=MMETSP0271-20121206/29312_1 /TAXON_ID=71861 /ORGANISM="Scrippsiella trochoidea, Strain CCMP3099" /LENGTH=63 /DNA_ID=CAMNT_0002852201 /DNA_START=93 /DNA_END=281 /DNA_ORIENTATION=-